MLEGLQALCSIEIAERRVLCDVQYCGSAPCYAVCGTEMVYAGTRQGGLLLYGNHKLKKEGEVSRIKTC